MRDCFGVEYNVRPMPGDGLCGYRSLSYALTGNYNRYSEVIEDLFVQGHQFHDRLISRVLIQRPCRGMRCR